jgi:hypothetical protein
MCWLGTPPRRPRPCRCQSLPASGAACRAQTWQRPAAHCPAGGWGGRGRRRNPECGRLPTKRPCSAPRGPQRASHLDVSVGHIVGVQPRDRPDQLPHEEDRERLGEAFGKGGRGEVRAERAAARPLGHETERAGRELRTARAQQADVRAGRGRERRVRSGLGGLWKRRQALGARAEGIEGVCAAIAGQGGGSAAAGAQQPWTVPVRPRAPGCPCPQPWSIPSQTPVTRRAPRA